MMLQTVSIKAEEFMKLVKWSGRVTFPLNKNKLFS